LQALSAGSHGTQNLAEAAATQQGRMHDKNPPT